MKDVFQRRGRGGSEPTAARLSLGAFGKHPGWDDHILGIGAETEALARARQALYVQGIGGQVDSGAWERLEPEKRAPGFDHTLFWIRTGHIVLGKLWSSTDGKGRTKYPMVLCVDAEGASPRFLLTRVLPGLERLQQACRETTSAEQVKRDCRAAQDQLRALLGNSGDEPTSTEIATDGRKEFLARPELGPGQQGLLRVLHELSSAASLLSNSPAGAMAHLKSHHLRLPLAADSRQEGLLRWAEFLLSAVSSPAPLLLFQRQGSNWVDAILGEPASDDLFCLQASPKGLPLTTDIPYQLAPDVSQRLRDLTKELLGAEPTASVSTLTTSAPAPIPAAAPVAPKPVPPRGQPAPDRTSPAATEGPSRSNHCLRLPVLAAAVLLLLAGLAAVWFSGLLPGNRVRQNLAAKGQAEPTQQESARPPAEPPSAESAARQSYLAALSAAEGALQRKDYSNGIVQAELALKNQPQDPAATRLLGTLRQAQQASVVAAQRQRQYQDATNAAIVALVQMNYREATNQALTALSLKPEDSVANRLLADAQGGIASAAALAVQREYQAATNAAVVALSRGDFREATNQASNALRIQTGDATAAALLEKGNRAMQAAALAAQQEQRYITATNAAGLALSQGKFAEATNQAAVALAIKPADAVAEGLMQEGRRRMEAAVLDTRREQDYSAATNAAAVALSQGNYQQARNLAGQALSIKAGDPLATQLQRSADEGLDLRSAQTYFAAGDYQSASEVCKKHEAAIVFTSLVRNIGVEQKALESANQSFARGDYSFVETLRPKDFSSKAPFASLLASAGREKGMLEELVALRRTNGWKEMTNRLAGADFATVTNKPPFLELQKWAQSQPAAEPASKEEQVRRLDAKLEILLVRFGIYRPSSPEIHSEDARKVQPIASGSLDLNSAQRYLDQASTLKADFEKGDWLDPDRKKKLERLIDTIKYR